MFYLHDLLCCCIMESGVLVSFYVDYKGVNDER